MERHNASALREQRQAARSKRRKHVGFFSSIFISGILVVVSASLLRIGVDGSVPELPSSHLDHVVQNDGPRYDLSKFKLEMANLAKSIFGVEDVHAAGYAARVIAQPAPLSLKPGEKSEIVVKLENTGSLRWRTPATGSRYASLYTYAPKYHLSRLEDKRWHRRDQPGVLQAQTEVGETGIIKIPITAPLEPGVYKDTFQMAIEDTAWVSGGGVKVVVNVEDVPVDIVVPKVVSLRSPQSEKQSRHKEDQLQSDEIATPLSEVRDDEAIDDVVHKALLLVRSHKRIRKPGGTDVLMRFGFKNTGESSWFERGLKTGQVAIAAQKKDGSFAHQSWLSKNDVVKLAAGTVAPGDTEFFTFSVKTPATKGEYDMNLHLVVDGRPVEGGIISLPVFVTSNAKSSSQPVSFEGEVELLDEPIIRVGLFKTEEPVEFVSSYEYVVKDVNGKALHIIPKNTQSVIHYKNGSYIFYSKGKTLKGSHHYRLEPKNAGVDPYFTISNHEERPKWNPGLNYNIFRGTFELRYSEKNEKVWVINELSMEPYLWGLAEVSNNTPEEFQKAMAVAERTYAYVQLRAGTKHADRNFHVSASQGDQVYRGKNREPSFPNVVDAVKETLGQMVTYNNDAVVTPYFARSNGKTKSYKSVWGGAEKPWLVPVKTGYDSGKSKWGHGVGMSQRDATHRADKEDIEYKELLAYYYTDTKVRKVYK